MTILYQWRVASMQVALFRSEYGINGSILSRSVMSACNYRSAVFLANKFQSFFSMFAPLNRNERGD